MEKSGKRNMGNKTEKNMAGKKSILTAFFTSILRLSLAVALLIFLSIAVNAGDVTVGIGDIYSEKNNELFISLKNTEANGHDYRLVSAGSLGTIGVGKFAVYDATAGSARLTIDTNGNVGIGTTGPAAFLDIQTNTQGLGTVRALRIGSTGDSEVIYLSNEGTIFLDNEIFFYGSSSAGDPLIDFGGNTGMFEAAANQLGLTTGGTERIRIDSSGNVGIGTTGPSSLFHVNRDDATRVSWTVENDDNTAGEEIWQLNVNALDSGGASQNYVAIDTLIQTATAGSETGVLAIQAFNSGTNQNRLVISGDDIGLGGSITATAALTGASMVVKDGSVGIGTTSPQSALQVNGYVQLAITSGAPLAADCDSAAEEGRMKFDSVSDLLYICSGASGWVSK